MMEKRNLLQCSKGSGGGSLRGLYGGVRLAGLAGAGVGCLYGAGLGQWQRGGSLQGGSGRARRPAPVSGTRPVWSLWCW